MPVTVVNAASLIALTALGTAGCSLANETIPAAAADSTASTATAATATPAPSVALPIVQPMVQEAACDRAQLAAWMKTAFNDRAESVRELPRDNACATCLRKRVLVETPNAFRVDVKACIAMRYGVACVAAIDEQRACLNTRCNRGESAEQQQQQQRCAVDAVAAGACKSIRTSCVDEPRAIAQLAAECATSKALLEATAAFMCGAEGQRLE